MNIIELNCNVCNGKMRPVKYYSRGSNNLIIFKFICSCGNRRDVPETSFTKEQVNEMMDLMYDNG